MASRRKVTSKNEKGKTTFLKEKIIKCDICGRISNKEMQKMDNLIHDDDPCFCQGTLNVMDLINKIKNKKIKGYGKKSKFNIGKETKDFNAWIKSTFNLIDNDVKKLMFRAWCASIKRK